jgi:hypothetical protein
LLINQKCKEGGGLAWKMMGYKIWWKK